MTVDIFTLSDFTSVLKDAADALDMTVSAPYLKNGEYVFDLHETVENPIWFVHIRSSIDETKVSADSGEDSIRVLLQFKYGDERYNAKKNQMWITRVPGWERRLSEKIVELTEVGNQIKIETPMCPHCQKLAYPGISQSTKNPNRPFASCSRNGHKFFKWMDVAETPAEIITETAKPENPFKRVVKDEPETGGFEVKPVTYGPSKEQQAVIDAPLVPVRVIAAPGSGKTFTIAHRYGALLKMGLKPSEILVVTFSKTMADDMLKRIVKMNPVINNDDQAKSQISTIHAFCNRTLRDEAGVYRSIPKDWEMKKTVKALVESIWHSDKEKPSYSEVMTYIESAKHHGILQGDDVKFYLEKIEEYEDAYGTNFNARYHAKKLSMFRERLGKEMGRNKWWTFGDMLYAMEIMLRSDDGFRTNIQNRIKAVIVDESQDTNGQAMRILSCVAQPQNAIMLVGDVDQMLYRFQGATPEINLGEGFDSRYPDGLTFTLTTNYRSTQAIVETSVRVIRGNYQSGGGDYGDDLFKVVKPREGIEYGESINTTVYPDEFTESVGVASDIANSLKSDGVAPGDIFVGARTKALLANLELDLTREEIPFINLASAGSFWKAKHIQMAISYFRLALDHSNTEAFKYIYNVATANFPTNHRWLGRKFLESVGYSYENVRRVDGRWSDGVDDLISFVKRIENALENGAERAMYVIVNECVKPWFIDDEGLAETDEAENGKLDQLDALEMIVARYENAQDFLDMVDNAIKSQDDKKNKNWDDYVVISTVHRLKGLERKIVYGIGISELAEEAYGLLPHTFSMRLPDQKGVLPVGTQSPLADERCIFFVLITRAIERVYLSSCLTYRNKPMNPSRFILEMSAMGA